MPSVDCGLWNNSAPRRKFFYDLAEGVCVCLCVCVLNSHPNCIKEATEGQT